MDRLLAHDGADHCLPADLVGRPRKDDPAVAQGGDTVGDGVHLVELVVDEQHPHAALGGHPPDRLEKVLHLRSLQGGGGLVEQEKSGIPVQGGGNLDELPAGHGELADLLAGRHIEAELVQEDGGLPLHLLDVEPEPHGAELAAEKQVLRDGEVLDDRELLIDAGDPPLDRLAG